MSWEKYSITIYEDKEVVLNIYTNYELNNEYNECYTMLNGKCLPLSQVYDITGEIHELFWVIDIYSLLWDINCQPNAVFDFGYNRGLDNKIINIQIKRLE